MSEVVQNAEREFWRPPVVAPPAALEPTTQSGLVEVCDRCETEFIAGSRFCHVCGATRSRQGASHLAQDWLRQALIWIRHLEFHNIERWIVSTRQRLGLPTLSLMAFAVGLGCLIFAIAVGMVFAVRTTLDWEAVQIWRIEWLLGATASFLAGILLKKSAN
jgi:hypothetical protein